MINKKEAEAFLNDRVKTSRLLGSDVSLVLHGGGNTSVKIEEPNIFGEMEELLYVKGSGWDLATIEKEGFSPLYLKPVKRLAGLERLSDLDMASLLKSYLKKPSAPAPSVEAILHAIIPYRFVDHTHSNSVVTISNSVSGREMLESIYGKSVLILPYIMPGFILSKQVYDIMQKHDLSKYDAIILEHHGVFTYASTAKEAYDKMIATVEKSNEYLAKKTKIDKAPSDKINVDLYGISCLRKEIGLKRGLPVIAKEISGYAASLIEQYDHKRISKQGLLTPDHVIRNKRIPLITNVEHAKEDLDLYEKEYESYFNEFSNDEKILDKAPRWAIFDEGYAYSFGANIKEAGIIADIAEANIEACIRAEQLGGWKPLSPNDIFDVEYWELEQAKLNRVKRQEMAGKVAIVTGSGSGIGKACKEALEKAGVHVVGFDISEDRSQDVNNYTLLSEFIDRVVLTYGGIDIIISNAGLFPSSQNIDQQENDLWQSSLDLNLTSHRNLIKLAVPYLKNGFDPTIVLMGSKNVPAPGPGQSAYSVAKAGLTQLGRVAALELGKYGIRVNIIHPNQVFDTGAWAEEVLSARAKSYGLKVEEYKTDNVLKTSLDSNDVAGLVLSVVGKSFNKVTGAQIPVDGGNNRVI